MICVDLSPWVHMVQGVWGMSCHESNKSGPKNLDNEIIMGFLGKVEPGSSPGIHLDCAHTANCRGFTFH